MQIAISPYIRNFGEPWECCDCDCTEKLEQRLASQGEPFLESLLRASCATVSTNPQGPATGEIPSSNPQRRGK